jgi:hypothetical protein
MSMMKIFALLILLLFQSCGGGTTTGNPVSPIQLRMQDRQPFALIKRSWDLLIAPAHAAATGVKFCFKRLRFKPDAVTNGSNFDLAIGEVDIIPGGFNLLTVSLPHGTYERVEFDLEKECDGTLLKPSVSFTNGAAFSSQDHITIKFEGTYVVGASGTLTLDIDPLFDALDLVASDNDIKPLLEAATGDFP